MRTLTAGLAAALFVLAAGGALASTGSIVLDPGQQTTVATYALKAGDAIDYTFSASPDVTMKIEVGGTDAFHTSGPATGTFTATADGTYTVSFHNEGGYVSPVSYSVDAKYNSSGTILLVAGAGAGVAAVAAIAVALALRGRRKAQAPYPVQAPPPPPPPR